MKINNFLFRESYLFRGIETLAGATNLTCEVIAELVTFQAVPGVITCKTVPELVKCQAVPGVITCQTVPELVKCQAVPDLTT
jgi:hypothetical protein